MECLPFQILMFSPAIFSLRKRIKEKDIQAFSFSFSSYLENYGTESGGYFRIKRTAFVYFLLSSFQSSFYISELFSLIVLSIFYRLLMLHLLLIQIHLHFFEKVVGFFFGCLFVFKTQILAIFDSFPHYILEDIH